MKLQTKQNLAKTLGNLRSGLLAAIAEMDLKGIDPKVTQAMCIIEEAFGSAANGRKIIPRQVFLSGMAQAKVSHLTD